MIKSTFCNNNIKIINFNCNIKKPIIKCTYLVIEQAVHHHGSESFFVYNDLIMNDYI